MSTSQRSQIGQHDDIKTSFTQCIRSEVTAKPIGETVSVSTRSLSFEDNTVITNVPCQVGSRADANTGHVNVVNMVSDKSAAHTISAADTISAVRQNVVSDS